MPFHTISVLTRESLGLADEMYAFFVEEGIDNVCFNVEESEGQHVSEMMGGDDVRARFHASEAVLAIGARRGSGEVRAGGRQHDLCGVPVERCTVPQPAG